VINTLDTAVGDYLDKVARVLDVPWDNKMPGAALEQWSRINETTTEDIARDIAKWDLPRPLSLYKKNVPAFTFTGLRTAVEKVAADTVSLGDRMSLGRAAQALIFEHVTQKCILGMKNGGRHGSLVVSGGVARNMAFRKMYLIR